MSNHDKSAAMRAELMHRVANDFLYKADFSQAQNAQWKTVKKTFETFRADIKDLLEQMGFPHGFTPGILIGGVHGIEGYTAYKVALRETERWCNTAIANDFKTGSPVDITKYGVEVPEYEGPSGGDTIRHQICDAISQKCFDLIIFMVTILPMGRALSVAVTRMQDVRGWLLDTVNAHYEE